MNISCSNCDHKKNSANDICTLRMAEDGFRSRCVGLWSKDKHYYLKRYIDIFSKAMHKKWKVLCFIDFFAGPGKCFVRPTGEEIDGSPLIALQTAYEFSQYFFVDKDDTAIAALDQRLTDNSQYHKIKMSCGDANNQVKYIVELIPDEALALAFIDPTGWDFTFSSMEILASKRVDLMMNLPIFMSLKRNLQKFRQMDHCKLDDAIGDTEWRLYTTEGEIIQYYKRKLNKLGYKKVESGDEISIRTSANVPLYSLLFASKHPLGHKFWQEACKIDSSGQRQLFTG